MKNIAEILELHRKWLAGESDGVQADLSRADLSRANLSGADLCGANLFGANLRGTNLRDANLSGADLSRANLSDADLVDADLVDANLSRANLSRANLSGADLSCANLHGTNLSNANLSGAIFQICGQKLVVNSDASNFTRVTGSKHDGYRVDGYLKIGCKEHTVEHWVENVGAIARSAGYSEFEVFEYENLIQHVFKMTRFKGA